MYADASTTCQWNNNYCLKVSSSNYMYIILKFRSNSEWYKYFNQCTDIQSQTTMNTYCGNFLTLAIPFSLKMSFNYGFYGKKNLYCGWVAINKDPSNVINVNFTRYVIF